MTVTSPRASWILCVVGVLVVAPLGAADQGEPADAAGEDRLAVPGDDETQIVPSKSREDFQ